jgi:hypothetical protein
MDAWSFARSALVLGAAAAMLGGCGLPYDTAQGRPAQGDTGGAVIPGAQVPPTERLSSKTLLYVSDWITNAVFVYDYGSRAKIGELSGFRHPSGQCVDAKNDVWIADFDGEAVVEYAHGGSQTIERLATDGHPIGCAVDIANGNLAVSNFYSKHGSGNIQIWKNAQGNPTTYEPSTLFYLWPPAYDVKGNLFVEGRAKNGTRYGVAEIRNGAASLRGITLKGATIHWAGAAEWDGAHIALTDQASAGADTTVIYRIVVQKSVASVIGRTHLSDKCHGNAADVMQPFMVRGAGGGETVIGGNLSCSYRVALWSYPAGGNPKATIHDAPQEPFGLAISP